jgi:hypothetical protein
MEHTQIVLIGARRFFMFIHRNESLSISNFVLMDVLINIREDDTAPTAASPPAATLLTFVIL